jgi:hypothetical protein
MPNALNTSRPVQLLLAPPAVAIQEFVSHRQTWIEEVIGCPLADAVTFEFYLPFYHLVLSEIFAGVPVDTRCIPYTKVLQSFVTKWELPPESTPHIELGMSGNLDGGVAEGKFGWNPQWNATRSRSG